MGAGQGSAESVRGFAIGVGRGIALLLRWPGCLKRRRAMPIGISASGLTWRANSRGWARTLLRSQQAMAGFEVGDHVFAHGVAFDFYAALRSRPSCCCQ